MKPSRDSNVITESAVRCTHALWSTVFPGKALRQFLPKKKFYIQHFCEQLIRPDSQDNSTQMDNLALTLVLLTWICPAFANSVDPDQLASALFAIKYVNL